MGDEEFHERISNTVESADLVCLAGFLFLWRIPEPFIGRVINIHPALLPEFGGKGMYGHHVHEAVLTAGRKESGCTVHFCDNQYDHGPIILQRRVPVLPGDTPDILAARVFEQECIAYPQAVQLIAEGRVRLEDGVVMQSGAVTRR
jgi:folate-dependent phosphoribosylglycinamide formyltransferase PurN